MSTTTENTTVTSIEDTIRGALQEAGYASYMSYAGPVVAALTRREQEIAEQLIDVASEADIDEEQARDMIRTTGLSMKEPEPEVEESDDEDGSDTGAMGRIEQMLTSLTGRIDSLTDFARNNGYRG